MSLLAVLILLLIGAEPAVLLGQTAPPSAPASPSVRSPVLAPVARGPAAAPAHTAAPPRPLAPSRFAVVLNPAHGGADGGARLSSQLFEKDLVLTVANRLRTALTAHSIPVVMVRNSDVSMPALNRAQIANHALAAACITLHATTSGSGVHLFTSSLTPIPMTSFLPWETAQGAYTGRSLRLASEIDTSMNKAGIPVTLGRTALQPLDSFTCPAVVVELAPLIHSGTATPLSDPAYQERLANTLAAAIEQWQQDWRKP